MQPPTTRPVLGPGSWLLRSCADRYRDLHAMAVGVAWTTLSHSHRDSYAARPIRAEGLAPCGSVRALASLSAAFYKHSVP